MPKRSESSGERFLLENDLVKKPTARRREVLGCLACRWSRAEESGKPPRAYGYQILQCRDMAAGTLYPLLRKLEEVGVVETESEELDPSSEGRPARRYVKPAQTELGEEFKDSLTIPGTCPLEGELPPPRELNIEPLTLLSPSEIAELVTQRNALIKQWRVSHGIDEDRSLTPAQYAEIRALPEWQDALPRRD